MPTAAELKASILANIPTGTPGAVSAADVRGEMNGIVDFAVEKLTANRTYYVATTGNDTTGDGSSGNPWLTITKALDYVARNLFLAGYTVKIQLADGTYNGATVNGDGNPHIVGGYVWLSGNDTTPANVLIQSTTIEAFGCGDGAYFFLSGMKVESTVTAVIGCFGGTIIFGKPAMGGFGGRLIIGRPQGAAWSNLINCSQAGVVYDQTSGGVEVDTGGITIGRIAACSSSGYIALWKVQINGNLSILTAGFVAVENGVIWVGDWTVTGGTVTGKRYSIDTGGVIYGKALEALPGDVAGTYNEIPGFTLASGTLVASSPALKITQTWNDGAVAFTALSADIVSTASAYGSQLVDMKVDAVSRFRVRKDGTLTLGTSGSQGVMLYPGSNSLEVYNYGGTAYAGIVASRLATSWVLERTTDVNALFIEDGWNNVAIAFKAIRLNITDTASDPASKLMDLQLGGASKFSVGKDGSISGAASATFAAGTITTSKPFAITQTWNDAGVAFIGLDFNLTDTLSHAASAPVLFRVNGSTKFALRKDGAVVTKPPASATPGINGDMLVEATSDTLLTTKFKGSDGTIRSAGMQMGGPLTGVVTVSTSAPSGGNDGDVWYQYT
jgi:hypothetical protein